MENTTITTILKWFEDSIESRIPISAFHWIDAAMKLNVLVSDIDDQLASYEGEMANHQVHVMELGETAAKARIMRITAIDYKDYLKLKAKRERVTEFIRLAKKRSTIEDNINI